MTLQVKSNEYPSISLYALIYIHLYRHVEKYIPETSKPTHGIDQTTQQKYPDWLISAAKDAYNKMDKYYPESDGLVYVVATGNLILMSYLIFLYTKFHIYLILCIT